MKKKYGEFTKKIEILKHNLSQEIIFYKIKDFKHLELNI